MKRFFTGGWAMAFLFALVVGSLFGLSAHAEDARDYTLFWSPDDNQTRSDINSSIKDSGIGGDREGIKKTSIFTKGGRLGNQELPLSWWWTDNNDSPTYTKEVYCTLEPTGVTSLSVDPPGDDKVYISYMMAVAIAAGDTKEAQGTGTSFVDKITYDTLVGFIDKNSEGESSKPRMHIPSANADPTSNDANFAAIDFDLDSNGEESVDDYGTSSISGHTSDRKVYTQPTIDLSNGAIDNDLFGKQMNRVGWGGSEDDIKSRAEGMMKDCMPKPVKGQLVSNYRKLSEDDKKDWDKRFEADGGLAGASTAGSGGSTGAETGTNCKGGAMGWLFCPLINYMAKTVQFTAGLIDNLMQVRFLAAKDSAAALEKAWRAFLSISNIMLVVAFLFIIFSQATSMGLGNYGIKKMLPRLIIAAILMNLSFYICAVAIDLSNIVGGSIMGFLLGEGNSVTKAIDSATGGSDGNFISGAIGGAAMIGLLFFVFTPVVLSIIAVFIMLIGRQVILMVLVLVSPLAFVAWLLPNTDKYFKKWYEIFFQMLIIYPMVMLMFGASLYLSNLIGNPDLGTSIIQVTE